MEIHSLMEVYMRANSKTKFNLPALSSEVWFERILENYKKCVNERSFKFIADEVTVSYVKSIADWLANYNSSSTFGLMIYGTYGSGKTMLCNAVRNTFYDLKKEGLIKPFANLFNVDSETLQDIGQNPKELSRFDDADCLFIDDVGSEDIRLEYGCKVDNVKSLLIRCYHKQILTIMSTNFEKQSDIVNRYGKRLTDRINEQYTSLRLDRESFRGKGTRV